MTATTREEAQAWLASKPTWERSAVDEARSRDRALFGVGPGSHVTQFILGLLASALRQADEFELSCELLWEMRRSGGTPTTTDTVWRDLMEELS